MMNIRGIYVIAWVIAGVGAAILAISGKLDETTLPVLGFVFSTLLFGGFVAVLPWWLDRQYSPKP